MPNIDIQRKIEAYLQGRLSSKEIEELWTDFLLEPEYLDYTETLANLQALNKDKSNIASDFSIDSDLHHKRLWFSFAAVIILVIAILVIVKHDFQNIPGTLSVIPAGEFESAEIMRSSKDLTDRDDSLLNLGYGALIEGKTNTARRFFNRLILTGNNKKVLLKAWINLGILDYNTHDYKTAVIDFNHSMAGSQNSPLYLDKSIWLLANSYLKTGKSDSAKIVLRKSVNPDGIYAQKIQKMLHILQNP